MDRLLALSADLASAVERAARSVLAVHGRPRIASTGIQWRPGLLVTASHTVQSEDTIEVVRPDGGALRAQMVGRDAALDVAVLRLEAGEIVAADIGDSDAVRVGHLVLAVGAGPRASWGIVSAIDRPSSRRATGDAFRLDLTLYPGFSGGPLVDARGTVVGMNTSGGSRQLQLAIPASAIDRVVDAVVRHGRVPHAYLGVSTQRVRVPAGAAPPDSRDGRSAVIVVEIQPGSPAAAALLVGDVILTLDGVQVRDPLDLRAVLRPERIGQHVTASVIRAGRVLDVGLAIGERPERAR